MAKHESKIHGGKVLDRRIPLRGGGRVKFVGGAGAVKFVNGKMVNIRLGKRKVKSGLTKQIEHGSAHPKPRSKDSDKKTKKQKKRL